MTIGLMMAAPILSAIGIRTGARSRPWLLLLASYAFHASFGLAMTLVLAASSVANFFLGEWIRRRPTLSRLWTGIAINVAVLAVFKYLPALPGDQWSAVVMPIGMSFWTFQALSYLFDVYREEPLDPTLVEFCVFLSFWPTVVSGPVARLPEMLPQFRFCTRVTSDDVAEGMRRIAVGLLMKLVLAQLLIVGLTRGAAPVGFDDTSARWGGLDVWVLAIGFGFQLFLDFAGYSHIAIGAARLFGFRLPENFAAPFASTSPSVFWTRWHMSLSSWIRDYVFVPLATLVRAAAWRYTVLVIAMVLFGAWHGARLTFVAWGAYHGLLLVAHRITQQVFARFRADEAAWPLRLLSGLTTFLLISLGWIFFRAQDLHHAGALFAAILTPASYVQPALPRLYYLSVLLIGVGLVCVHAGARSAWFLERANRVEAWMADATSPVRVSWQHRWWLLVPMLVVLAVVAGLTGLSEQAPVAPFTYAMF